MTSVLDNQFLKTPEKKEGIGELLKTDLESVKTHDLVKKISDSDTLSTEVFDELKKLPEDSLDALLIKLPLAKRFKVEMQIMSQKKFYDTIKSYAQNGEFNPSGYVAQASEVSQMSQEIQGKVEETHEVVNGLGLKGKEVNSYKDDYQSARRKSIDAARYSDELFTKIDGIPKKARDIMNEAGALLT